MSPHALARALAALRILPLARLLLLPALLIGLLPGPLVGTAQAHALDPGYLQIDALGQDRFAVLWREPDVQGRPMGLDAVLPGHCTPARGADRTSDARGWAVRWVAECPGGIAGGTLRIDGLARTSTDTLLRVQTRPEGPVLTHRVTPDATEWLLPADPTAFGVLASYGALGMEHILSGWDHLLFVLGLMLLVRGWRRIVAVITAFTVAHSLTLVATALGWLVLPGPPVEAVIALSIAYLAAEALRQGRPGADAASESLTVRAPWIVAFGFGLLHGMGFGSALMAIGLPPSDLALALLSFNLGVEAGQLVFVAVVLALRAGLRRLAGAQAVTARLRPALAYGIGTVAMFWSFERIAAFGI